MNKIINAPKARKTAFLIATAMMAAVPAEAFAVTVLINSFAGTSQRDTQPLSGLFNPPDVNGTVGLTQYAQLQNGVYAVYDKNTGALQAPRISDSQFFINAGGTATRGDVRILFDPTSQRYIATGFGATTNIIQIAVSTTSDALGPFRATSFIGAAGTADYPTLALTGNTVTIGTNNFNPGFVGVTLNTISRSDLFGPGAPSVASLRQFNTPAAGNDGFAQQGVNRAPGVGSGTDVVAASNLTNELITFNVSDAGVKGPTRLLGGGNYQGNRPGRQPDLLNTGNARVVDTLDDRVSASVYEANGRIYAVHTVTPVGQDHTVVRISVLDATTKNLLSETDITGPDDTYDFYEGSIAVNSRGEFVVGYVRSGDASHPIDGNISIFARSYTTNANGTIASTSGDILIKRSEVDDFHQGSPQGQPAAGRQRFGDYSSVSLDPTNDNRFYVINQFADLFNNVAGSPPGFARYGTFIGIIGINQAVGGGVPEPATWAMMIVGFGFAGAAVRRRRMRVNVSFA
jgi:PEP-CTERM motif